MKIEDARKTRCPMSTTHGEFFNCQADECAWWMEAEPDEGECAILTIAKGLTRPIFIVGPDHPEIIR